MSNVATKSLILSQPKVNQSETNSAPTLPFISDTTDTSIETRVEIPGVDPSTVDVDFEGGSVVINCERGVLTIPVDPTVDPSKIKADILWGLLTVTVPLPKPPVARSIKVSLHDAVKTAPSKARAKQDEEFTAEE
jgi:HSP20 family molecular chaperone IbpA